MDQKEKVLVLSTPDQIKGYFTEINEGMLLELPKSCLVIKVKVADVTGFILSDKLPADVMAVALELQGATNDPSIVQKMDLTKLQKAVSFIDDFFAANVLEPTFTPEQIKQLPLDDKMMLFKLVDMGVRTVKSFREEQTGKDTGSNS